MRGRRFLISLTFLKPFITIGDKKNSLREAGAISRHYNMHAKIYMHKCENMRDIFTPHAHSAHE